MPRLVAGSGIAGRKMKVVYGKTSRIGMAPSQPEALTAKVFPYANDAKNLPASLQNHALPQSIIRTVSSDFSSSNCFLLLPKIFTR